MLNLKEKVMRGLLWVEEHSRKMRKAMEEEKRCNAIARAGLKRIMDAYTNSEGQRTNFEHDMYQIAKDTYEKLTENDTKEETPK